MKGDLANADKAWNIFWSTARDKAADSKSGEYTRVLELIARNPVVLDVVKTAYKQGFCAAMALSDE